MNQSSTLLVVDDEFLNGDMLSRRLRREGFKVTLAESAAEALERLRQQPVDLILLDSMMPGMTGVELLKLLRATYSPQQLPIIMVTAVNESQKVAEALNLGANDYVTKPVDMPVVLARIQSQLSRKTAETALRESEARYALAARGTNDGLWDWDLVADTVYYSPRWKAMLGYREGEIGESPNEWLDRVHPAERPGLEAALQEHWRSPAAQPFEHEHRMRLKNGPYRWMLSRGLAVRDEEGRLLRMAGSQSDVTDKKVFDALTGLPNRLLFIDRLSQAMERAQREPGFAYALLFIDLDRFKLVNDSFGHVAGDRLLVEVAERLKSGIRGGHDASQPGGNHILARLGGDEFAVLAEDIGKAENATRIAERILRAFREPFALEEREVFCRASIGIAPGNAEYLAPEELIRDSDTAMYRAKAMGGARYAVFDSEMRAQVVARLQLENDLEQALARNELELHYQPKVNLRTGELRGFEALVRWNHPTRGLVMPGEFIPIAEESGLIVPMGAWILTEACRQMRRWHDQYPQEPPLDIAVNISVRQFRESDLLGQVAQALTESGLRPSALQLEITESVLLDGFDAAVNTLNRLKELGVGLKVDDFGTGYSSLQYLCSLPFDTLKIDTSFTFGLLRSDGTKEVVKTILNMAHNLGMTVIAEGIEQEDQAKELLRHGCELGQGYYFARPACAATAEQYIVNGIRVDCGSGSADA